MRPTTGMRSCELEVLAERGLGVHGHGEEAGEDLLLVEAGRGRLVEPGHVALGVDLADEDPLAPVRGEQGQGRGHRGLAHAALAGDEDQLEVEVGRPAGLPVDQVGPTGRVARLAHRPLSSTVRRSRPPATGDAGWVGPAAGAIRRSRIRPGGRRPAGRPRRRPPWPPARRPGGPCGRSSHRMVPSAARAVSMSARTLSRSASSGNSMSSSFIDCTIPIRTSTWHAPLELGRRACRRHRRYKVAGARVPVRRLAPGAWESHPSGTLADGRR